MVWLLCFLLAVLIVGALLSRRHEKHVAEAEAYLQQLGARHQFIEPRTFLADGNSTALLLDGASPRLLYVTDVFVNPQATLLSRAHLIDATLLLEHQEEYARDERDYEYTHVGVRLSFPRQRQEIFFLYNPAAGYNAKDPRCKAAIQQAKELHRLLLEKETSD